MRGRLDRVGMRLFAARVMAAAGLVTATLVTPHALAHGGLSMDEDRCKLRVGRYVIHFVGYQPDSPSGPREFCEDIPETGRTIVVLDFLNDELRDLPTEVRIVRDTASETDLNRITVLHLPPTVYPSGSLNFELNFDAPGKFVGLVTVGGANNAVSRFPFSVGRSSRWLLLAITALLIGLAAVALYRFALGRRSRATGGAQ